MSTIEVSASCMNLIGPREMRPNYLKTTMASRNIMGFNEDLADLLKRSYQNGPAKNMKAIYRWSEDPDNYGYVGPTIGHYYKHVPDNPDDPYCFHRPFMSDVNEAAMLRKAFPTVDPTPSVGNIEIFRRNPVYFVHTFTGPCMYTYWAKLRYWTDHFDSFNEASKPWEASYNSGTGQITLHAPGRFTDVFTPSNFDINARYLYYSVQFSLAPNMGIYKIGSGDAELDAVAAEIDARESGYYPFVPLRANNIMVQDSCEEGYEQVKKIMKKAAGLDVQTIVDKIAEHDQLADMDGAHIMFGVQVDTIDKSGMKYIYEFYRWMAETNWRYPADKTTYVAARDAHEASVWAKKAWLDGGSIGTAPTITTAPATGLFRNDIQSLGAIPGGPSANFFISIDVNWIKEEMGTGLGKVGAKVGEMWWSTVSGSQVLKWQISENMWKSMIINGSVFTNNVYGRAGTTSTNLSDAIGDDGDTLFALPLHKEVLSRLGLVDATQVYTQCYILVVGAFKVITKSILGFVIFLVIFLLIVIFPPLNIGVLGAGASIGASLGFVGIGAAIVGAIVNMIAAMIIMKIITKVSVLIFGEKIGAIIGAVVGFVAMTVGTGLLNGQSLSSAFGNLLQADKLIALTNAVGGGVAGYISAATQEVYADIQAVNDKYDSNMKTLNDLYAQNIGYGMGTIDPMELTQSPLGIAMESSQQFLDRTLMTGTDIAELSKELLNNFVSITTDVTLPMGQA